MPSFLKSDVKTKVVDWLIGKLSDVKLDPVLKFVEVE